MLVIIFGSGFCLNYAMDLAIPERMHYAKIAKYESNDAYLKSVTDELVDAASGNESDSLKVKLSTLTSLSPDQLTAERDRKKTQYLENAKANNLASLISTSMWVVMALFFFCCHWRLFRKAK
jgi:sorbitol-specific phosphotransferase system component IIBC